MMVVVTYFDFMSTNLCTRNDDTSREVVKEVERRNACCELSVHVMMVTKGYELNDITTVWDRIFLEGESPVVVLLMQQMNNGILILS